MNTTWYSHHWQILYIVKFWTHAPPGSKFFQFHAGFFGKFGSILCWHPLKGWRPTTGKSWIRYFSIFIVNVKWNVLTWRQRHKSMTNPHPFNLLQSSLLPNSYYDYQIHTMNFRRCTAISCFEQSSTNIFEM